MSKAVKSVTRSVSNVVKGAVKVVTAVNKAGVSAAKSVVKNSINVVKKVASPIVDAVKKIASSKLGKVLIIAATIYFGGAALAGGFGSSAAGGSFLSGMSAGVSSAATSLSSAWGSAMAGELGTAGSTIGNAWGAAGTAGGTAAGGQASAALSGIDLGGAGSSPANMGTTTVAGGTPPVISPTTPPPAAGAGNMSVGEGIMGAAKIQAGTALIGGVMQGKAAEQQRQAELDQAQAARDRYNANAGAKIFADSGSPDSSVGGGQQYDAMAEAQRIGEQRRAEFAAQQNQNTGLVARGMQFQQPTTNNNFPVYNPYYYRG
jgi:hypothetical protein